MRIKVSLACSALILVVLLAAARGQDKAMEQQYRALATARTDADLAYRRVRSISEDLDNRWRLASAGADAAHTQVLEALRKAQEDEQRRSEELRNPAVIEEINQRRASIEQEWAKFVNVERPALDSRYRAASQAYQYLGQLFNSFMALEASWKDNKIDIAAMQGGYEAMWRRAVEIREQAENALGELEKAQRNWKRAADAATRPSR